MTERRPRRIVRRAVMALAGVVLVAGWYAIYEPPVVRQSRAIKLGMDRRELGVAMKIKRPVPYYGANGESWVVFGDPPVTRRIAVRFLTWIGVNPGDSFMYCPVRVKLSTTGRAVRIERRGEVEESPPQ